MEEWKTEGRKELNKIRLNNLHAGRLFIPQRGVDGEQTFSMYYFNTLHQINKLVQMSNYFCSTLYNPFAQALSVCHQQLIEGVRHG